MTPTMIDRAAAAQWPSRYQAGECETVWAEMLSLGPDVRSKPYLDPAWSVAQETMRRARHNIETIIRRLDQIGYEFWNGEHGPAKPSLNLSGVEALYKSAMAHSAPGQSAAFRQQFGQLLEKAKAVHATAGAMRNVAAPPLSPVANPLDAGVAFSPPTKSTTAMIRKLEKHGLTVPLSLKAWAEMVGGVNLSGAHPTLCFWQNDAFPGVLADPLMIALDDLMLQGEQWLDERDDSNAQQQIEIVLGWDADTKANLVITDEQIDQGYSVMFPAPAADVVLRGEPHQRSFVDHLRVAFRFGGFPGWERQATRPEKELGLLSDGLLPI